MDRLITSALLTIAATVVILLVVALGLQQGQWIADHHCIATGQQRREFTTIPMPIAADGTTAWVPDTITYWAYLCDDRDEPHWFAVTPTP